jgi:hypothetical protein
MWDEAVTLRKGNLVAQFLPEKGMNLVSYRKGSCEIIDQSTRPLFEERFAGLGALIGPHFHHRKVIPPIKNEALFPHIARVKAKGVKEPFSHGIGRYAPWTVLTKTQESLNARLKGSDAWQGVLLKDLEGQDFVMDYEAQVTDQGLHITLSVQSERPSVVGLHTYYRLDGKSVVKAGQNAYPLDRFYDDSHPFQSPIALQTETHQVKLTYNCEQDSSWQLWHPENASFACMEPLSAKNPKEPVTNASRIKIAIMIEEGP